MAIYPNRVEKDFYDVEAGDETHRYGDYIPYSVDWSSVDLEIGDMVAVDGDGNLVEYTAGTDQDLLGVLYTYKEDAAVASGPDYDVGPDPDSTHATVKTQGTVVCNNNAGYAAADVGTRGASGEFVLDLEENTDFAHILLP